MCLSSKPKHIISEITRPHAAIFFNKGLRKWFYWFLHRILYPQCDCTTANSIDGLVEACALSGSSIKDSFQLPNIIDETMRKKIIKSFFDSIILVELTNGTMSGYDLMVSINQKFGVRISSGTVYFNLYALEKKKLVSRNFEEYKKVFSLTEKGTKHLEQSIFSSKMLLENLSERYTK